MFIGRKEETGYLLDITRQKRAALIVVHGRRRVGKTTLIQHTFKDRNLIKIEGLEKGGQRAQLYSALQQLIPYFPHENVASWRPSTWGDFFRLLAPLVASGKWTILLEEYQWLSNYKTTLTAELKLAWDNKFSANNQMIVILCGSSPSFMVGKVLRSKALHNRSQHELHVKPLPYLDAKKLLPAGCSTREMFDAYLLVGGVPEYLKRLNTKSSIFLSFIKESFRSDGFFIDELNRILVSSLSKNPLYGKTLKYLAKIRFATRPELLKAIGTASGGTLTELLEDLTLSGFISSYVPLDKPGNSLLLRFILADPFLRTYFLHLAPHEKRIRQGDFDAHPARGVEIDKLKTYLGFAFEFYCKQHSAKIAKILGFSAVQYDVGSYFSRTLEKSEKGFQLDLVFQRKDNVHTICEIKYTTAPVGNEIILPFERRIELYRKQFPVTLHRVLISASGAEKGLKGKAVFDEIIDLEMLVEEKN